jgi:flagellar hook-length control protein FliK
LKLIELSEAQNASVTPELTAFEAEALPAIQALSSHELMALLHGFQDAQQPQLQALQTELTGQALLQEQALTQGLSQQQLTQGLNLQVTQQVTQPQVTPNAIMPLMEAVVRPQEVMPALNQVKLNASQREGIIRQIAHSFRTRGGGTQTTEIRLNPEELGLVKLKVEMRGTDVRVFFAAENPAVMDLLSENIDQLKAMLTEQEFNLTEAGVWQEFNSQGDGRGEEGDEDYGSDERPDLRHRPKSARSMSPLPGRFRATI